MSLFSCLNFDMRLISFHTPSTVMTHSCYYLLCVVNSFCPKFFLYLLAVCLQGV
uniref:Exocyst complex component 7 n=1 Tax=Rhizophora mucronata TaxID=61149 RepID=A0A2P2IHH7_RHIMU